MKITFGQVAVAVPGLEAIETLSWPIREAYKISRLIDEVEKHYKKWLEMRNKLITKLGETRPATDAERAAGQGDTVVSVLLANQEAFQQEMGVLAAIEVEIASDPIALDKLPEGEKIQPIHLRAALPFFAVS